MALYTSVYGGIGSTGHDANDFETAHPSHFDNFPISSEIHFAIGAVR
jgi:hypothetical protein